MFGREEGGGEVTGARQTLGSKGWEGGGEVTGARQTRGSKGWGGRGGTVRWGGRPPGSSGTNTPATPRHPRSATGSVQLALLPTLADQPTNPLLLRLPGPPHPRTCNNNKVCEPALGETPKSCPRDCPAVCGDGFCDKNRGETATTCPKDCFCGDGVCSTGSGGE